MVTERIEDGPFQGLWEFPGGKIGAGEELEEALARELSEEIGVQMLASDHLMSLRHEYPDRHVEIDFFLVTQWQNEARGLEGQGLKWVTVDAFADVVLLPAALPVHLGEQLAGLAVLGVNGVAGRYPVQRGPHLAAVRS